MRRRLLIATLIVAALAAWSAAAASAVTLNQLRPSALVAVSLLGVASGTDISFTQIPVRLRGDADRPVPRRSGDGMRRPGTLRFLRHRDLAAAVDRQRSMSTSFRDHGQTEYDVSLRSLRPEVYASGQRVDGGATTADVRFAPNGSAGSSSTCTDAAATGSDIEMPVHLRAASLTPGGRLAVAARHALRGAVAERHREPAGEARRRRRDPVARPGRGRLASSADFAVHGLAGTVTSTVQLRLGRPRTHAYPARRLLVQAAEVRTGRARATPPALNGSVAHRTSTAIRPPALRSARAGPTARLPCACTALPETLRLSARSRRARRPLRDRPDRIGTAQGGNPRGILVLGALLSVVPGHLRTR